MTGRLQNRIALVTGAGDGIGAAVTQHFIAEGARVVAADISAEKLAKAHKAHDRLVVVHQDICAPSAPSVLIDACVSHFGGLDILINNAGNSLFTPVETLSDEEWHGTFDVNVHAAFRLSRAAIPLLRKSSAGRIVHVTSVHTVRGRVGQAAYTASKLALSGLSKTLAIELGPHGITSNCIAPGPILTGLARKYLALEPAWEQRLKDETTLGRLAEPEEVSPLVLFLASDEAAFITGTDILIDGGMACKLSR